MKSVSYNTCSVCAQNITFDIDDDGKLHNVKFTGGCAGNLAAISKLVEGMDAKAIANKLRGNDCRGKGTSCADQFAKAIDGVLNNKV